MGHDTATVAQGAQRLPAARHAVARLNAVVRALGSLLNFIAEAMVVILVALFAIEVIMRYFFSKPSGLADQVGALLMTGITFLALARTYRAGAHVSIDLLVDRLRPANRRAVFILTELATLAVALFMTWYSAKGVIGSYEEQERLIFGMWTLPLYIPQLVMPIGLGLLSLQIAVSLLANGERLAAGSGEHVF